MAPARKSTKGTRPSGSRSKKVDPPATGLFFGGTQLIQAQGQEDDEDEDQTYLYGSDADEDAEYGITTGARKRRTTKIAAQRGGRGRAAAAKQTESDYDSDDKRIIHYKKLGYKDDYISNKLIEEGRQQYSAKTISTRWVRLKKIVERKEEEQLDDELSDWHIGEDDKLRNCFNAMEAKYEVELLKLKERKWKEIAAAMAEVLREKKYTPKACKERWESLEDGTALIAIELDEDPDHRKALREARVAENKRRRAEQKAAVIWALGEKDRKLAEKRAILEQKDRERQAERARKQAEKDEDDRIKAEQRAGLEKRRAEQRAIEDEIKQYHEGKRSERKNADAMYMYYTGKKLNGRRDSNLIKDADNNTDYDSDLDLDMADSFMDDDEKEPHMPDLTDAEESSADESGDDMEITGGKPSRTARATRSKGRHAVKSKKNKVTLETLINPRSIMNDDELAEVLARRNLRRRARDETHAEVVARLAAADAAETQPNLRDLLGAYFERRKGTVELLARRLQEYDAASSARGIEGITAIDSNFKRSYEGYEGKFAYAIEE